MTRRGLKRLGRKRFCYVDAHQVQSTDDEQLGRILRTRASSRLGRCVDLTEPAARLQATGIDAAGRACIHQAWLMRRGVELSIPRS